MKFFSGIMMFPIYFILTKERDDLILISKAYFIVGLLFVFNFVISRIFSLGRTVYDEDSASFDSGNFSATVLYIGSVVMILTPVLMYFSNYVKRNLILLLSIAIGALLLISMRRTAIIIVAVGLLILFYYYVKKNGILQRIVQVGLLIALLYPFVEGKVMERLQARSDRFEEGALEKEGRYVETIIISENIFSFKEIYYSLFGKELFNSAGNYSYPDPKRVIHADYNILLSGSGLIGIALYLMMFISIYKLFRFEKSHLKNTGFNFLIWVIGYSLFFMLVAAGFSSGLLSVTYRAAIFSIMGSFLGYLSNTKQLNK
ncbi:MAG: hypothetical protein M0Q90_13760 [Bacteroidales bacterium]|nr:hypothetical protein [Bacteroidales bacterium]